ncbi:two-component sensor histidine kinase [Bacteroidia bacterium]|nr:two-component sensor histidine kinase [Bacteroidia bacterium]
MKYKHRLFLYFFLIFALFSAGILLFERVQEKKFKTEALEEKLDAYTRVADAVISANGGSTDVSRHVSALFPANMRFTLIDNAGNVLFDNVLQQKTENHANRPEIQSASTDGAGSDIRVSTSNNIEYLYYARHFGTYYVRVALPYNIQLKHFLQADNFFLYFLLTLFAAILLLINYVSGRFGKSIKQLLDLIENGEIENEKFPNDETGEIAAKILANFRQLKTNKKEIATEREKLLQHVHSSEEGLCFYAADHQVQFYNGLFIQYLNTIEDEPNSDPSAVFADAAFDKVTAFLTAHAPSENYFETQITRQGKHFAVRVNIFEDNSFELIINDTTGQAKNRLLKQEMTGNITHELRTPVTGIRGYLETVLNNSLDPEKERYFLQRAYRQTLSLSELISDMGLLAKLDAAPRSFVVENINLAQLLSELRADLQIPLHEKNITTDWNVDENTTVRGNRNLLYSVFRNLTDNVIRYAGENARISIRKYNEDEHFYYFSYFDTGVGVPEEHLNRLFERFYRADEGRTRESGGSGLGLSIVKNAVAFHKGTIVAKNRVGGGLEFLFTLGK